MNSLSAPWALDLHQTPCPSQARLLGRSYWASITNIGRHAFHAAGLKGPHVKRCRWTHAVEMTSDNNGNLIHDRRDLSGAFCTR